MIKTIIIDDEPLAIQLVKEYLEDYPDFKVVHVCSDGFQGVKAIQEYEPELIFLDVQMPKISGFEMLELLDLPPAVIFTTAFDEFAIKAFDAHAVDYLLKPYSKDRFAQAIERYSQLEVQSALGSLLSAKKDVAEGYARRIVLKEKGEIKILPVSKVRYLEANDDYVNIYTGERKYLKNKTLRFFEDALDPGVFVRVHRSYIVKVAEILKIESYDKEGYLIIMHDGDKIPVSRTGMSRLKKVLGV